MRFVLRVAYVFWFFKYYLPHVYLGFTPNFPLGHFATPSPSNSSTFCQLSLLLLVLVVVVVDWQKRILFDIISAVCNFIFEPDSDGVGGGGVRGSWGSFQVFAQA